MIDSVSFCSCLLVSSFTATRPTVSFDNLCPCIVIEGVINTVADCLESQFDTTLMNSNKRDN